MAVCTFFLQGRCRRGDACRFVHPEAKKEEGQAKEKEDAREEVAICTYYLRGHCARGNSCWFRHEEPPAADGADIRIVLGEEAPEEEQAATQQATKEEEKPGTAVKAQAKPVRKASDSSAQDIFQKYSVVRSTNVSADQVVRHRQLQKRPLSPQAKAPRQTQTAAPPEATGAVAASAAAAAASASVAATSTTAEETIVEREAHPQQDNGCGGGDGDDDDDHVEGQNRTQKRTKLSTPTEP